MILLDPHVEANSGFDATFLERIKEITRGAVPVGSFEINVPILLATDSNAAKNSTSLEELRAELEKECIARMETISKRDWPVMSKVRLHFILFPLSDKSKLVEELKKYAA